MINAIRPSVIQAGPLTTCAYAVALTDFRPTVAVSWGFDLLHEALGSRSDSTRIDLVLRRSDLLLCDCVAAREAILARGYPNSNIIEFPWGLEKKDVVQSDIPDFLHHKGWSDDSVIVISIRSFESVYDVETAINSFGVALNEDDRLRLVLLGDGSLRQHLMKLVQRLDLESKVLWVGRVAADHVFSYLEMADVYLSCSLTDGTSVSLLQAMYAGLPAVVTDVGGNREWVEHGKNGWLAQPRDIVELARHLRRAANLSVADRATILKKNRENLTHRANWEQSSLDLMARYAALMGEVHRTGGAM